MSYARRARRSHGFTLIEIMVVVAIIALLVTVFFPHFWQARARANFSSCKQNLKSVATSLQGYYNDNGTYPTSLSALTPNWLGVIPTCPQAGYDTFTAGYSKVDAPSTYTVVCTGSHHVNVPDVVANQPLYVDGQGVLPK